jgi:hypothetical protein
LIVTARKRSVRGRTQGTDVVGATAPADPAVETFDETGNVLTDKPYMTIDNNPNSPFRDRIYVTWTQFAADGTAYIYEVHSDDYGQTFSSPVVVSTTSATLCTYTGGAPTPQGTCNNNQFSDPFTGSDGALYVAYANYNNTVTGNDNRNQVLLTKSTDGGQTFGAPVKVSDYYELPDCLAAQGADPFRACVPEKGTAKNSIFRAANYPSGGVNPTNPNQVVVTVASYINADSNESNGCTPDGLSHTTGGNLYIGTKTPGACNNKIMLSVSNNAGASFTGTSTDAQQLPVVNTGNGQATTDQWFQWAAFTPRGTLVTSYYDRAYGDDETSGNMDVSVSTSTDLSRFKVTRATSASMPLPTQFPDANGNSQFIGDYTGVSALSGANPIWSDTRNPDAFNCPGTPAPGVPPALCTANEPNGLLANDQQIYTRMTPAS